jgi:hypothetical protein
MGKTIRCRTKNLDHVKVMQVEESVLFRQTEEGCVILLTYSKIAKYSFYNQKNVTDNRSQDCLWIWLGSNEEDRTAWTHTFQG